MYSASVQPHMRALSAVSRWVILFEVIHFALGGVAALLAPAEIIKTYLPYVTIPYETPLMEMVGLLSAFYIYMSLSLLIFWLNDLTVSGAHLAMYIFYILCLTNDLRFPGSCNRRTSVVIIHVVQTCVHFVCAIPLFAQFKRKN